VPGRGDDVSSAASILVIDDEPSDVTLIQMILGQQGYRCLGASSGMEGIRTATASEPNLVILDLGLPDLNGVEVARTIREQSMVPIIVLSVSSREQDKISALDGGANDYVMKPFATGELLARVRAVLRPAGWGAERRGHAGVVTFGDLSVDFDSRTVTRGRRRVSLTRTEYRLLEVLLIVPGRVLTHRQIVMQVWGPYYGSDPNYVRVYMRRLRQKIEDDPVRPAYLVTELGVGYRFRVPP
jgi:two-component system KDP operon response regulator KdpE